MNSGPCVPCETRDLDQVTTTESSVVQELSQTSGQAARFAGVLGDTMSRYGVRTTCVYVRMRVCDYPSKITITLAITRGGELEGYLDNGCNVSGGCPTTYAVSVRRWVTILYACVRGCMSGVRPMFEQRWVGTRNAE